MLSRRSACRSIGMVALAGLTRLAPCEEILPTANTRAMAEVARQFMQQFAVPALSVAIAKQGNLVYREAFGKADEESHQPATPNSRFRIASVTKPFTSAAIFSLQEAGKLSIGDRVFGPNTVLGQEFGAPSPAGFGQQITIEHLLTHTCGGWQNDNDDPMFLNPRMGHAQLIRWTLQHQALRFPPGTHYAYSNFGYCLLGRIIERLTSKTYPQYVRETILQPCGIRSMTIAGNTKTERAAGEVVYYGQGNENPYDTNVTRMDSHGGWIATASDLVNFAVRVDGFPDRQSLLKRQSIRSMTTGTAANPGYAKGWAINSAGNWWHSGSLPGTSSILVRTAHDFCWAALTNTRRDHPDLVWRLTI